MNVPNAVAPKQIGAHVANLRAGCKAVIPRLSLLGALFQGAFNADEPRGSAVEPLAIPRERVRNIRQQLLREAPQLRQIAPLLLRQMDEKYPADRLAL